jgi:hypothetical protein
VSENARRANGSQGNVSGVAVYFLNKLMEPRGRCLNTISLADHGDKFVDHATQFNILVARRTFFSPGNYVALQQHVTRIVHSFYFQRVGARRDDDVNPGHSRAAG